MEPEVENEAPPTRRETLIPALAVAAVAVAAVAAAVMVQRAETQVQQRVAAESRQPSTSTSASTTSRDVVHAPPLNSPTQSMGGSAACKTCGVVQTVVAVYDEGGKTPRGFQMHIRMDDGSLRTVEQRGALAAGSRVVVEGKSLKPM
ncbi:MAG TPA: hypothetical protein VL593_05370 [Ramlibacter sp.]|nr:hypothetical protein [Ramlibacter sp.]